MNEETGGWVLYPPLSAPELTGWAKTLATLEPFMWALAGLLLIGGIWAAFSRRVPVSIALLVAAVFLAALTVFAGLQPNLKYATSFFDPAGGGDPVYLQHLLWFLGHPEVWWTISKIVTLAIGLVWGMRALLRRQLYFWLAVFVAAAVGLLIWCVLAARWAQASYVQGLIPEEWFVQLPFQISGWLVIAMTLAAVVKFWRSAVSNPVGMLFVGTGAAFVAAGLVIGSQIGGASIGAVFHDTYYEEVHYFYVRRLATVFAAFALAYFIYRSVVGVDYNRLLGGVHWLVCSLGIFLVFLPQYLLGQHQMPRRYYDYEVAQATLARVEHYTTAGAVLMLVSVGIFAICVVEGIIRRVRARRDVSDELSRESPPEGFDTLVEQGAASNETSDRRDDPEISL